MSRHKTGHRHEQIDLTDALSWATAALDLAVRAFGDAEFYGADDSEILRLCDEVIVRRLGLRVLQIRAGWTPPHAAAVEMVRDRELVRLTYSRTP